jgi:hypothetical protein
MLEAVGVGAHVANDFAIDAQAVGENQVAFNATALGNQTLDRGLCFFTEQCGLLFEGLHLDALDRTGDCAFDHLGGHSFYHGLRGQVEDAFNAPVLPELQRLTTARQGQRPWLIASVRAGQGQFQYTR